MTKPLSRYDFDHDACVVVQGLTKDRWYPLPTKENMRILYDKINEIIRKSEVKHE